MTSWIKNRWFLIALVVLIPGGLILGSRMTAERVESLVVAVGSHATPGLVALVLFLMSVTLDVEGTWVVGCFAFNPDGYFPATTFEVVEKS